MFEIFMILLFMVFMLHVMTGCTDKIEGHIEDKDSSQVVDSYPCFAAPKLGRKYEQWKNNRIVSLRRRYHTTIDIRTIPIRKRNRWNEHHYRHWDRSNNTRNNNTTHITRLRTNK